MTLFLSHLRRNVVAYLALAVALGTGTAYAAASIPDGSVTAAKLHKNAVTSNKIKNGALKPKDLKKPTYVASTTLGAATPPAATPDVVSVAPYDFQLPTKGQATVTVFIPALTSTCPGSTQPSVGLYIDNLPIPGTRTAVPGSASAARPIQLTSTLSLGGGAHTGRVGVTCSGGSVPTPNSPGAETWSIVLTG